MIQYLPSGLTVLLLDSDSIQRLEIQKKKISWVSYAKFSIVREQKTFFYSVLIQKIQNKFGTIYDRVTIRTNLPEKP